MSAVTSIVVGVDGSAAPIRAARWAAVEAVRRNLPIRLVHAHAAPAFGCDSATRTQAVHDALFAKARDWLRTAAVAVAATAPDVPVRADLRLVGPVPALTAESRRARLLVLGARGLGGLPGLMLGSTAEAVAGQAACPVAVIPAGPAPAADAPVVVGVDGSAFSDAAVAVAFDEASARKAPLIAVHAWSDQPMGDPFARLPEGDDWAREAGGRLLAEQLAGWQDKHPEVAVRPVVTRDRPAFSLLAHASAAQLLVVGSQGRGGFAGMQLGSTSRAVLHGPPCPVIVARPEQDDLTA
jgi:nucleotide-binding universal stress UspA family protein